MQTTAQKFAKSASMATISTEYVDQKNAAKFLGMSQNFLVKLHNLKQGPARSKVGNAIRCSISDLRDWMQSRRLEHGA